MKEIKKILFITLSNIGDAILTLPVLDALIENFPESKIDVMAGPRPKEIFENNPRIDKVIVYDKRSKLKEKIRLFWQLRAEKIDLVVDLRNSFFGAFLPVEYRTSPFLSIPSDIKHMKEVHLYRLSKIFGERLELKKPGNKNALFISPGDKDYINNILRENGILAEDKIIAVAAGGRSHIKRWQKESFFDLINRISEEFKVKIILVGDRDDKPLNEFFIQNCGFPLLDLSAKTSIGQLACLLKRAQLVITNDSANLHLASYLNVPTVAIFGPTDELKYGPWSDYSAVAKKEIFCRPCRKAQCGFGNLECMRLIKTEDVLRRVRALLDTKTPRHQATSNKKGFKRILIARTDRIGDVVLSTPVIKALRDKFPDAYICFMTGPEAKDIVEGNPFLDEVIVLDKDSQHRGLFGLLRLAGDIKRKKIELALALHPTNRVHLLVFLARILKRVGFNRRLGFLLTDKLKHTKQLGEKHELEYNLDFVRYLGIEPEDRNLFMPIRTEAENWVNELFAKEGIGKEDKLMAIHPGASCISKVWPAERFAQVADRLIERYGFKVFIIAGKKDIEIAERVSQAMRKKAINLAGATSVSQLASLLKRCDLFISNDSGPVHIAVSFSVPVISIFGRNQKGLSPKRWGPLGQYCRILHKEVGCKECFAHNCTKGFICLRAITVEDVLGAAESLIKEK
jgi:heptosyltransferase-2